MKEEVGEEKRWKGKEGGEEVEEKRWRGDGGEVLGR